jgi:hypothetical protein
VARDFGVSWHAAMAAVRDHGRPPGRSPGAPGRPDAVGLDETSFLAGTVEHPTLVVTGIVDLDAGRLIDVLIRLANASLDEVRRRTQQATTGHRGRNPSCSR